jgi:outer membrane receptor protein involved in Fe transport
LNAGLSLGYGERKYQFSGNQGFAASKPWGTLRELQISLPLRYRGEGDWSYFGIPSLRYNGEKGADSSDSQQWGLLAGAAYRVSDKLSIGPGLGVFSELESGTEVFPILLINWKINDALSLETGSGLAASRGPGLALRWTAASDWSFTLAARYEKTRFRLDKDGPVPNGVGQDKAFPVGLTASYRPDPRFEISLIGGADFAGNLRLEDANGDKLDGSDYEIAPFAGLFATAKF